MNWFSRRKLRPNRTRLTCEPLEARINPFFGGLAGSIVGTSVPGIPGPTTAIDWAYDAYEAVTGDTQARQEFNEVLGQARGVLDVVLGFLDVPGQLYMRANADKYLSDWEETVFQPSFLTDNSGEPVYYVNGVTTPREAAEGEAQALADQLAREVRLIYNGTSYVETDPLTARADFGEAIKDKFWFPPVFQHNPTTKAVAGMLDASRRAGERVNIVGHSQGAFIVNNAIRTLNAMGYGDYTFNSVAAVLTGASMTALESAGTARFGRIDNPGDPFAELLGTRSSSAITKLNVVNGIGAQKHDFRKAYVGQVTDEYFFGPSGARVRPDGYESNDTPGDAHDLGTATPFDALRRYYVPLNILSSDDVDWFTFRVGAGSVLSTDDKVAIQLDHDQGDLDLFLYRDPDDDPIRSSTTETDREEINLNGLGTGTYYLKVEGFEGATGRYGFNYQISPRLVVDSSERNDTYRTARAIDVGSLASEEETPDGLQIDPGVVGLIRNQTIHNSDDVDWYSFDFDNWVGANSSVSITFTGANGDLDMALYILEDGRLKQLASSEGEGDSERISLAYRGKGVYYVKVYGYDGDVNNYTLRYNVSGAGLPVKGAEPANNTRLGTPSVDTFSGVAAGLRYDPANFPQIIGIGGDSASLSTPLTIHSSSDEDWYRLVLEDWGRTGDYWGVHNFRNEQGDIDLQLYDAAGNLVPGRSSTGTGSAEAVPLDGLAPGTYFVRVYGAGGDLNWYTLGTAFEGMVEDSAEAAGGDGTADALPLGTAGAGDRLTGVREERSIHSTADDDYYTFELGTAAAAGAYLAIDFFMTADSGDTGDLDLQLLDDAGNVVRSSGGVTDTELVDLAGLPAGRYFARVYGARSTNYYAMRFDIPTAAVPPTVTGATNVTVRPGGQTTVPLTVGDDRTPAGQLVVTAASSDPAVAQVAVGGTADAPVLVVTAGAAGSAVVTVTVADADDGVTTTTFTVAVAPTGGGGGGQPGEPLTPRPIAVSGSADGSARLFARDAAGAFQAAGAVSPFGGFAGDVRSARGDFDADGVPDTVMVTGPGTRTVMAVVSGANGAVLLGPTDPFGDANFTFGGFVTAGDIDGDGRWEWVVTPELRGGPRVVIFRLNPADPRGFDVVANFFGIQDPSFRDGARAALGDVNRDGILDVFAIAAANGGPRTALFNGADVLVAGGQNRDPQKLTGDFFAALSGQDEGRGGRSIAAGDVTGDGFADFIVTGDNLLGTGNQVTVFSGADLIAGRFPGAGASPVASFAVGGADPSALLSVARVDADGDARADLAVGSGAGQPSRVKVYRGTDLSGAAEPASAEFDPFGTITPNGVFVG